MEIRPATTVDFPAIRELLAHYPETIMQEHLPEPEEFLVATEEGTLIACCALEVYSKRLAEVRSLAVSESFQGRGIATQLVAACLKRAQEQNIHEVLTITGATSLFEKQGFSTFKGEKYAMLKVLGNEGGQEPVSG